MLDESYKEKFDALLASTDCSIQLPARMADFFSVRGDSHSTAYEERKHLRIRARAKSIGYFESTIPGMKRDALGIPIFTADFSRGGCGFLSAIQIFPSERLRLILPTFWLQIESVRCRKLGPNCYEVGSILISKNQPGPLAFSL